MPFRDRNAAGRELASMLGDYANRPDVLVLALPRGGIPVGVEVAKALHAPLDVLIARRLVTTENGSVTIGAVAAGGARVIDERLCRSLDITEAEVERLVEHERAEVELRDRMFHECVPRQDPRGRTVIVVDDGMATGASMRAAVLALERSQPGAIVVAVPVASSPTCAQLSHRVSKVVYCYSRDPVYAVSLWYESYPRLTDEEACQMLREAAWLDAPPQRASA